MTTETLWFQTAEQADRFASQVIDGGHQAPRIFAGDFSFECSYQEVVVFTGAEVTLHRQSPYSRSGQIASRFRDDRY